MFTNMMLLWAEIKLTSLQHFCMSYPAFLRQYGIYVRPTGARL